MNQVIAACRPLDATVERPCAGHRARVPARGIGRMIARRPDIAAEHGHPWTSAAAVAGVAGKWYGRGIRPILRPPRRGGESKLS